MKIYFEDNLDDEALIVKNIVKDIFNLKCEIKKKHSSRLFKFRKKLKGYEVQITRQFKNAIILTNKDIFPYKSTSKEDDWIFGIATNNKQFIISFARLKTNSDSPSKMLKIPKKKYKARIEFIAIHELGHWLVKNQNHYKSFILDNPETGHKIDLGMHCLDNNCIMSEFNSVKELDKHIKTNHKNLFCEKCLSEGFNHNLFTI